MNRQEVLGEIMARSEALDLSRKTKRLMATPRIQRLMISMYELERQRLTRGTVAVTQAPPEEMELTRVLALTMQVAQEHHQAKEGNA